MTIGQLDDLTVKVYVPESKYGQIDLGDIADLTTNSFPDEVFEATVIRIADKAEYTPRNVQTSEDRATTVYAIELSVDDPDGKPPSGVGYPFADIGLQCGIEYAFTESAQKEADKDGGVKRQCAAREHTDGECGKSEQHNFPISPPVSQRCK